MVHRFNNHSDVEGKHASLSASKYHWINYDDDKFEETYRTAMASALGTRLHAFAAEAISLGIKLPKVNKTLNMYVNDAIGFRMKPEVVLWYSDNAFGTADAIIFTPPGRGQSRGKLRIHDLKTGVNPAKMTQLEIYTAFFCLEYGIKPGNIDIELRIYQNDEILIHEPQLEDILFIMGKLVKFESRIQQLREERFV
jgi:hypothetical protein